MKEMNLLEKIIAILLLIEIIGVIVGIIIKRIELITLFMGLGVITCCICPNKKKEMKTKQVIVVRHDLIKGSIS